MVQVQRVEICTMASNLRNLSLLLKPKIVQNVVLKRRYSNKPPSTLPENLRRAYEHFQREDGVPVYLKGGVKDKLLLGFSIALVAVGFVDSVCTVLALDVRK